MAPIIRTCSGIAAAILLAQSALAATDRDVALDAYVQARLLDAAGVGGAAADSYAIALTSAPTEERVASRAYRQAIEAGDQRLAIRAARALDVQQKLPGDGRVLLYIDALRRSDWRDANLQLDRLEGSSLDFLAPIFRAWLRYGAREANPLEPLDARQRQSLTGAYSREQRVYLLLALKQIPDAEASSRALAAADNRLLWMRISAASRLVALKHPDSALGILTGNDPVLEKARAMIGSGVALPGSVDNAADGSAVLLARVASDLLRDNAASSAVTLARLAAFASPDNVQARLVLAQALSLGGFQRPALELLDQTDAGSLFASTVREIRFTALQRADRGEEALAMAMNAVSLPDADLFDHARLGEALSQAKRFGDAATAYGKAIAAAEQRSVDGRAPWSLWQLYGGALDSAGDWPKAKSALQKAVALAPEQAATLNHLGYAMLEHGDDLTEATRLIAKAASLKPDDPAITDSLGWAFYLRGQTAESIAILERAVTADPTEAALGEHLGDAYWKAGRRVDARYAWNAALIQADGDDQVKRIAAKIADGLP